MRRSALYPATQSVYSYGISDAPQGVFLYASGKATGVQVTGKPGQVTLPAPFDQVPSLPGHEIHDKFVVCGLNGNDPVVYCGSSNLAAGGEAENGDNLLAIFDADVATAFAIEALGLVDHYNLLDRMANPKKTAAKKKAAAVKKPPSKKKTSNKASSKKEEDAPDAPVRAQVKDVAPTAEHIFNHEASTVKSAGKKKSTAKTAKKAVKKKPVSASAAKGRSRTGRSTSSRK